MRTLRIVTGQMGKGKEGTNILGFVELKAKA